MLVEIGRLEPDWRRSLEWRDSFVRALASTDGPAVIAAGVTPTNCFWLRPKSGAAAFKGKCKAADIVLGDIDGDRILARANPTLLGESPEKVAQRLAELDRGGQTTPD